MNGEEVVAWFDTITSKAREAVEAIQQADQAATDSEAQKRAIADNKRAIIDEVQLGGAESLVTTAFQRLSDAITAKAQAQETYGNLTNSSKADVIEAEVTAEVEVDFAADGKRSNAEQRRAEVVKRLNAHKDWLWLKDAVHDAKGKLANADAELSIAERNLRVGIALLDSKVTTLRALS